MYCSFRFFLDSYPTLLESYPLLELFEVFASELGVSYDFISYILLDPDNDVVCINKSYSYDLEGKAVFLSSDVIPQLVGCDGCATAPFFEATFCQSSHKTSRMNCVRVEFPANFMPMIIKVDFDCSYIGPIDKWKFIRIVERLHCLGYHVNNAYFHVYSRANEAETLDGGQIGVIGSSGRKNIRNSLTHRQNGCLNHVMDVFCANAIGSSVFSDETWKHIYDIVGQENFWKIDDIVVFFLTKNAELWKSYGILERTMARKLTRVLRKAKAGDDGVSGNTGGGFHAPN